MNIWRYILVMLPLLLASPAAQACTVCFGAPGSKDTQALSVAIGLLLGVLAIVLGGVVSFIVYLSRHTESAELLTKPTHAQ